jgi:predicted amidophosphoribosyltransferase
MADVDCYAEGRLSLRVMVCGVFLIKFQYETKFYLLALIFFVNMWIPDGFANDLSINVTKSSYNNLNYDIIVPLPAFEGKISERGYNQAEEIAKVVSEKTEIPLGNIIRKIKDISMTRIENGQRVPLSRAERFEAVKGAYVCDTQLSGKKILLIDDVLTSGANSQECSKILLLRGAESVELMVAGRTREPV